jgi:hypothetical protein
MTGLRKFLLLGSALLSLAPGRSWAGVPEFNRAPLTAERLQVYADFMNPFLDKAKFKFLANRTFPLDLSSLPKDAFCLHDLQHEGAEESSTSYHLLRPEVLRGRSIQLVDAEQESAILKQRDADVAAHGTASMMDSSGMLKDLGVLALSEIVFDKTHHFAVLKYVFLEGAHVNSSAIVVLEEVNGHWVETTARTCSAAINEENSRR